MPPIPAEPAVASGSRIAPPSPWLLVMIAGVAAWLWPIGLGGQMPVGGDATAFSIGLMSAFREALRAGRLPLWNDLWGYGFPGVAESQMGVYYIPHWPLYGFLSTEAASTASLAGHAFWGAIGTYWLGRRMGLSPRSAAIAGYAWTGSGTSLIQLSHHWYFPTASWMPWAWGLAWDIVRRDGGRRSLCALAAVLALQVAPGHFQVAFITQVGVLGIAAWSLIDRCDPIRPTISRAVLVAMSPAAALALAAAQVWPTYRNSQLTSGQRTADYLSWLPSPPTHYVNLVAPGLFRLSALWRPIVWDPFRAMPEEHFPYIGLVPLFLAIGAIGRGGRRDPGTRLLIVLAAGGLLLAFGAFVPGYSWLIRLPGFSFFRVPARWNTAALLAMALLAGKGLDSWGEWRRPSAWMLGFVAVAAMLPLLALLGVEMALASTAGPGPSPVAEAFDRATNLLPGSHPRAFYRIMQAARTPTRDTTVSVRLVREGYTLAQVERLTLDRERFAIYGRELAESGLILLGMVAIAAIATRHGKAGATALVLLAGVDLFALSRHRQVDLAPARPLVEQSPVLARLAAGPRGQRTVDSLKNLPMAAAAAPIAAYRTLDRDALPSLAMLASGPPGSPVNLASLRAVGASVRIFEPMDPKANSAPGRAETLEDPALAGWIYGTRWAESPEGKRYHRFTLWSLDPKPARAWLLAGANPPLDRPGAVLDLLDAALPLEVRSPVPERVEIVATTAGPATILLSQLADPEWAATLRGPGGDVPAPILPAFGTVELGAWQAIRIPAAGSWTVSLVYQGRAAKAGLLASAGAWGIWLMVMAWPPSKQGRFHAETRRAE